MKQLYLILNIDNELKTTSKESYYIGYNKWAIEYLNDYWRKLRECKEIIER